MSNFLQRIRESLFRVYNRKDLRRWEGGPKDKLLIYGVYRVMLDTGWESLVRKQIDNLRKNGLLGTTTTFFVSCIAAHREDVDCLKRTISSDKLVIISNVTDPKRYECPVLEFIKQLSEKEDCSFHYFHMKGVSYQSLTSDDRLFYSFKQKIETWREMLKYFIFDKWRIAMSVPNEGYDIYSYCRWPPCNYTMHSNSFWWAKSACIRTLPDSGKVIISTNRFCSEVWLFERNHRQFSTFGITTDLYFVGTPRSVYTDEQAKWLDKICFSFTYNVRKIEKHIFKYNYKKWCQKRFQKLKNEI